MRLLFRDALVVDGTGGEPFRGYVLVEEDRIAEVGTGHGPVGNLRVDREVDCGGRALLPGFINCHVHLSMDASHHPMNKLASQDSHTALLQAVVNARKMLLAGFTTVRDCGGKELEIIALRNAVNAGLVEGPRIVSCGQALLMTGGHFVGRVADGPTEVRRAAREMLHRGADFIKVMATGGLGKPGERPGAQELFLDELADAFRVAQLAGKTSAAHAHGLEGIRDCVRAGVTSVEHGTFLDEETADLMAEKGVFLVPTFAPYAIMVQKGEASGLARHLVESSRAVLEAKIPRFQYALRAGVKLAYGTDAGSPLNPHDDVVTEAREMAAAGASPMTVIRSLTGWAAELLQLDGVLGVIAAGRVADLVLVDGNPLEDLAVLGRPVLVLKEGRIVRG